MHGLHQRINSQQRQLKGNVYEKKEVEPEAQTTCIWMSPSKKRVGMVGYIRLNGRRPWIFPGEAAVVADVGPQGKWMALQIPAQPTTAPT